MATKRAAKKSAHKRVAKKDGGEAVSSDTCFTIMPFGGWFDDYYDSIYKPAIEAAGLSACRADDLYRPSTIINDIWAYTQSSKIILADLSGKNPNVFYELGLAHALAKPAILVAESMEDVPFDLRALRVLEYDKNQPRWGEELQDKITHAIAEVLAAPLQAVLPAFLSVKSDAKTKPVSEHEKLLLELRSDVDLLRNEMTHARLSLRGMPSAEAKELIKRYVMRGLPRDAILKRMQSFGVPLPWAGRQIDILQRDEAPRLDEGQ